MRDFLRLCQWSKGLEEKNLAHCESFVHDKNTVVLILVFDMCCLERKKLYCHILYSFFFFFFLVNSKITITL